MLPRPARPPLRTAAEQSRDLERTLLLKMLESCCRRANALGETEVAELCHDAAYRLTPPLPEGSEA